jgi:hypothetical protein
MAFCTKEEEGGEKRARHKTGRSKGGGRREEAFLAKRTFCWADNDGGWRQAGQPRHAEVSPHWYEIHMVGGGVERVFGAQRAHGSRGRP